MTILDHVLGELRDAKGPIRSSDLAARVGVTESALSGMVSVLMAKGRLVGSQPEPIEEVVACSGLACGKSCIGLDECPFIVEVPESIALVIAPSGAR
jgi:hypothetical protein